MFPLSLRARSRRIGSPLKRKLFLEPLEDRRLLAAGDLDPTFDFDGMVVTDVGNGRGDLGKDIAIQSDGKLVVVGRVNQSKTGDDFAVVRYNVDGSLDTSFGTGGIVRTSFGTKNDEARGVAIQADGKIVVGGMATVSNRETFAMARYNPNGTLDTSFDGDGKLTTNVVSLAEAINDIVLQPDGKIVAVGYAEVSSGVSDFAMVRYNPNGSLDTTFGSGGKVITPSTSNALAVAIGPDDKIVVSGDVIARYHTDGSIDVSFAGNGIVENATERQFRGIAVQADGRVVVTGGATQEVLRYDIDGNPDLSFDGDGSATVMIDEAYDVAVQPDGRIVATGQGIHDGNVFPMTVARLNADGSLDTAFGTGGLTEASFPNAVAGVGRRLAIQPDGRIVSAGFTTDGVRNGNWNFAVARFEGDSGEGASAALTDEAILSLALSEDWLPQRKKK